MPESWIEARDAYCYPVNLTDFADANKYDGWFESKICGCLDSTRAFQKRFAENAPYHLEAWYEVVYWKYYFIPNRMKRDCATRSIIRNIRQSGVTANELWELCSNYIESSKFGKFFLFQNKIVRSDGAVTVPATFPAFINPKDFPMVDSQVDKWVRENGEGHSYKSCGGPILSKVLVKLTNPIFPPMDELIGQWKCVKSWIKWCRFTAGQLTELTGCVWSPRDVEMAVFTAQRTGRTLNPLTDK